MLDLRMTPDPSTDAAPVPARQALPRVPWWALASAALAPVALIGGFLYAGWQLSGYAVSSTTISDLAAVDMPGRGVMTTALVITGLAHLVTALGLRPVPRAGRVLLGLGGVATVLVAWLPIASVGTSSPGHLVAAVLAFGALTFWPRLIARPEPDAPFVLRPRFARTAWTVMLVFLVLTGLDLVLHFHPASLGVNERILASLNALCPLVVVLGLRRAERA